LKQLSQTRSTNPFRPDSGILPPLLAGRERETAIFEARVARTRDGQPQHTALLGEWAIGNTTLLMHLRRLREQAGDAVVLSMAYLQSADEFLAGLVTSLARYLAFSGKARSALSVSLCASAISLSVSPAFTFTVTIGGRRIAFALAITRLTLASRVAGGQGSLRRSRC